MFKAAFFVITCLTNCGAYVPGQVITKEAFQFQVEAKTCGYHTRIMGDNGAIGLYRVVCR